MTRLQNLKPLIKVPHPPSLPPDEGGGKVLGALWKNKVLHKYKVLMIFSSPLIKLGVKFESVT